MKNENQKKHENALTDQEVLNNFEWNNTTQTVVYNDKPKEIWNCKNGYLYVTIYNKGWRKNYRLHRLIAMKYITNPQPEIYDQIDHIDGNKHNNDISNLRWVTRSENMKSYFQSLKKDGVKQKRRKRKDVIINNGDGTTTTTKFDGYVYYNVAYTPIHTAKTLVQLAEYMNSNTMSVQEAIKYPSAGGKFIIKPEYTTTTTSKEYHLYTYPSMQLVASFDAIGDVAGHINTSAEEIEKMMKEYNKYKKNEEKYVYEFPYRIITTDKVINQITTNN